jgi:hypothetical protein
MHYCESCRGRIVPRPTPHLRSPRGEGGGAHVPSEQDYHDKVTGDMPTYFVRAFTGSFTFSNFSISTLRN